jgi:hypothetical protein
MGLPVSRSIMEAHGGRLWAESTENHGSIFPFTLPGESGSVLRSKWIELHLQLTAGVTWARLKMNQPALQRAYNGLGAIRRVEPHQDRADVALYRCFCDT